jgi:hypothetical protein
MVPSSARVLGLLLLLVGSALAPVRAGDMPADLKAALAAFKAEGSRGWAFTQSTVGTGRSLVERFDPGLPEMERWTLLQKDGRTPTAKETQSYREMLTRRSRGETAPNVKDQIDPASGLPVSDTGDRVEWRFKLRATDEDDRSAAHMDVVFTLHRPTTTIERVVLASFEPFKPVRGVQVSEARTVIEYSLPEGERPTLLRQITVRLRGRAWWFKSMDQDMTVTYTDYAPMTRRSRGSSPAPVSP